MASSLHPSPCSIRSVSQARSAVAGIIAHAWPRPRAFARTEASVLVPLAEYTDPTRSTYSTTSSASCSTLCSDAVAVLAQEIVSGRGKLCDPLM